MILYVLHIWGLSCHFLLFYYYRLLSLGDSIAEFFISFEETIIIFLNL